MAAVTRQPFAPLNEARLQTLTSLKNRQNSISTSSPVKRKASDIVDTDDSENIDPVVFSKRSKGADSSSFFPTKDSFIKPASFILTKSASASNVSLSSSSSNTHKATTTPRPRSYLNPKSPNKINTGITKSTPLSAPAGRSPTRGKRSGILSSSRRRTGGHFRVDPPAFGLSSSSKSSAPFSLDAALKGTIPSYASRSNVPSSSLLGAPPSSSAAAASASALVDPRSLHEPESSKASWDFVIHEDTPEQEMTNLLQHSTCVLDISSDEETESRRQRERAEGKENVPPIDDISQTSRTRFARLADADDMMIEKERRPLGEMDVREYYSEGCDESSIVIVPGDDDADETSQDQQQQQPEIAPEMTTAVPVPAIALPEPEAPADEAMKTVEELMLKSDEPAPCAALLEPMEGTGESFEVWESGSAKDEAETTTAAVACS